MGNDDCPLLSPKAFGEYSPVEYQTYIKSLYVEPERAAPPSEYSVRKNAKGNLVLTVRRKPKWLTSEEVSAVATEIGWSLQQTWMTVRKKKIDIKVSKVSKKK